MCEVLDVPPDVRDSLSSGEISTICKESVVPGKVATKMVDLASSWILMKSKGDNVISQEGQKKVRLGPGEQLSKANVKFIQVQPVELKEGNRKLQATRADDAEIPEYLWNSVLVPDGDLVKINKLSVLRNFAVIKELLEVVPLPLPSCEQMETKVFTHGIFCLERRVGGGDTQGEGVCTRLGSREGLYTQVC
jgi:hypothetical protein